MDQKEILNLMAALAEEVIGCCTCMGMFRYSIYCEGEGPDTSWHIDICEGITELVGGKSDGAAVTSGFSADIYQIMLLLQPPDYGPFKYPPVHFGAELHDESPTVVIEGRYNSYNVSISIFAEPFADDVVMRTDEEGRMWETGDGSDDDLNE